MHPRNIFRTPPDYKKLALLYPEFKQFVKLDAAGNVQYDYKNENALRTLSITLLRHYFSLDVSIPPNTLVPTVPLRLNYVLWLEDLANCINKDDREVSVIDIGTGASCIYPLLIAKLKSWNVLAIDTNEQSIMHANDNIKNNRMEDKIKVECIRSEKILFDMFSSDERRFTFCMCNPPFYDSSDRDKHKKTRKHRPPPKNASSGNPSELHTPGGEVTFIKKLIEESLLLKNKVQIYTTMVGHKSNVRLLLSFLQTKGVNNATQTIFDQGLTTRWAIAWTFDEIDLSGASSCTKTKKHTPKETKMTYVAENVRDLSKLQETLTRILTELKTDYEILYTNDELCEIRVMAKQDTWSHARRRRREAARLQTFHETLRAISDEMENVKKCKQKDEFQIAIKNIERLADESTCTKYSPYNSAIVDLIGTLKDNLRTMNAGESVDDATGHLNELEDIIGKLTNVVADIPEDKLSNNDDGSSAPKKLKTDPHVTVDDILIELSVIIKNNNDGSVTLTFVQMRGDKSSNVLCTLYNYIVNYIKRTNV